MNDKEYTATANLGVVEIPRNMKQYMVELLRLQKERDKRERGCDCCAGDSAVYWKDNENNAFVDSRGEMLVVAKDKTLRFKVRFCPMCGRKFNDEPLARI